MAESCSTNSFYTFEANGGLILEIVGILVLFYAMMVLTDEFLMGEFYAEYIYITINRYKLSNGGGSCLIAFGSIIPEFTVNTVSCLLLSSTSATLGLSTVIGSGCFDFTICLGIAAFVAYFSHKSLPLDMSEFYVIYAWYLAGLVVLILMTIDGHVNAWEATGLLALTPVYLYYNFRVNNKPNANYEEVKGETEAELPGTCPSLFNNPITGALRGGVRGVFKLIVPTYTGALWQIAVAITTTILASFAITRGTVLLIKRVLCHLRVPESLVGLTILAWGNNIGDIMNSAVAAKRGNAQLSVSSVISTQVLNIHCSLGLPWVISTLIGGSISMDDSLTLNSLLFVIGVVLVSFLLIFIGGRALNLAVALMLTGLYTAYIVSEWTFMQKMSGLLS
jgi:Ca2+/Na+ antiporter